MQYLPMVAVVATIMNSSGTTSGGKKPTGKIRGAIAESTFSRALVNAPERILVVTNDNFFNYVRRELDGALAEGISIHKVNLPSELEAEVADVSRAASSEMTS